MFTPELDLRAIQIFLAVAEGKSVKKASEKLKISSPAISQALRLLEEDLGTELFCRDVRPLRLTASGRKLQTEGNNLLEAARSLRNKICSNEYVFQSLRLGIGESATSPIGPYLLALLRDRVSEISMESLLTAPLVEKLLKDEIDVLISVDPMFNDDRWVRREIFLSFIERQDRKTLRYRRPSEAFDYSTLHILRRRQSGQDRLRSFLEKFECPSS